MRLIFITHIHTTIYLFIMKITSVEMSFNQLKNVVVKDFFLIFILFFGHGGSSFLHSGFLLMWQAGPPL